MLISWRISFAIQIVASFSVHSAVFLLVKRYRILKYVRIFIIAVALANVELVASISFSVVVSESSNVEISVDLLQNL